MAHQYKSVAHDKAMVVPSGFQLSNHLFQGANNVLISNWTPCIMASNVYPIDLFNWFIRPKSIEYIQWQMYYMI